MAASVIGSSITKFLPMIKVGAVALLLLILFGFLFYYVLIVMKRKVWHVTIYEQKADGRIHIVGQDKVQEKKLKGGTITVYWMNRAKTEVIPPPFETVYRNKGKEFVDYLRVERDYIPVTKTTGLPVFENKKLSTTSFTDKKVRVKMTKIYDNVLEKIRSVKTTYFNAEAVKDRFIHIPVNRTMTAKVDIKTVPYDLNIMAQNKISNADEFFASKYEFWKKYGAAITLGLTIIFLIIVVFLTYDYMIDVIGTLMGNVQSNTQAITNLADGLSQSGVKPPN